ncbi:hypothetical protein AKJ09_09449 [Labilithrix luteola]|uniref:Fatty acid hydroxylase domain-containing protein n=1 Tax=Labilithrix luteola TaxID=1391654 RepID=A0A0K1QAH3_9BACT|nr:sterol desaturase family protein [Labilithrix luteola]AKV02786.1 hypothetical protein AKJ09_09449 [Labilithrix luteola]
MSLLSTIVAAAAFFVGADLVYTVDHYLVHHDHDRYKRTHSRHHRRYVGSKDAVQLDGYELWTYGRAALISTLAMVPLSLLTGNPGFVIGGVLKFVHSLLFHLYQHGWWSSVPLRKQGLPPPKPGWGFASAHYHAHHHAYPDDAVFTYAESWQGFDRILEWAHPRIVRYTKDGHGHGKRDRLERAGRATANQAARAELADAAERTETAR